MDEIEVPLGAYGLAHHVYKRDAQLDAEALDGALEAAAPLIVAAYLEQMRDSAPDPACTSWLNRHIAFLNGDAEQP